jgi:hypothetical protein
MNTSAKCGNSSAIAMPSLEREDSPAKPVNILFFTDMQKPQTQ